MIDALIVVALLIVFIGSLVMLGWVLDGGWEHAHGRSFWTGRKPTRRNYWTGQR